MRLASTQYLNTYFSSLPEISSPNGDEKGIFLDEDGSVKFIRQSNLGGGSSSSNAAILYKNTAQSFTSGVANVIEFNTASSYNGLTVDTSGYSITASSSGLHNLKSRLSCQGWTAGSATVDIWVNGAIAETNTYQVATSGKQTVDINEIIELNANDEVKLSIKPSVPNVSLVTPTSTVGYVQSFSHSDTRAANALAFSNAPTVGNLKIAAVWLKSNGSDLSTATITGWTELASDATGNGLKIFYKSHLSEDGSSVPLNITTAFPWRVVASEFSNVAASPFASTVGSSSTATTPSISVSVANATQVTHIYGWLENIIFTGMTQRATSTWSDGDDENHISAIYTRQLTDAGSTSTVTATNGGGDFSGPEQFTYALAPLVSSGKHAENSYLSLIEI